MISGKVRNILALTAALTLTTALQAGNAPHGNESTDAPTPAQALQMLEEGNVRYQAAVTEAPRRDAARRSETFSGGQHPFAAMLSCADSRVPPEILFDSGIGDLFVVRVAGNVADVDEIGTLEYGVEHLHTPLIVVMGHTRCGAVTAVVDGAHVPPNIEKLVDNIVPAAESTRARFPNLKGPALVQQAIRMNVRQGIRDILTRSEIIREFTAAGKVKIVGAVYDINSGSVEWMGAHPDEALLLAGATASTDEHAGATAAHNADHAPAHNTPDAPAAHSSPNDGHGAKPAQTDPHAQPHPKTGDHATPSHDTTHPPDESHGGHGESPTSQPAHSSAPKPHNFIALGSCLAGGALASVLTISVIKTRKGPAVPAPKTT